jgi:pimeloyl-ACP methyl ester carboxylesterase
LHAGIADRTMWEPQIEAFSDRYRCTTLDARGFGESVLGDEAFSRRDDLAAVMDAVAAERATLVGCSIGAGFALDFAIERPDRVDALVLVGTTPAGFEAEDDPLLQEMWPIIEAAIKNGNIAEAARLEAQAWVDGTRPPGASPQWLRDKVTEWCVPIAQVEDWGESVQLDPLAFHRLGEVQAPTLVIVGTADYDVIQQGCRATADGIPGAQLVELEGTAHLPNLEVTDAFNAALATFLA